MKKNYIQQYKDEKEEGELLKLKAEAAIREEEENERKKRERAMKNAEDIKKINDDNKRLKQIQHERELEEEAKI